jgi:hypothetical protein
MHLNLPKGWNRSLWPIIPLIVGCDGEPIYLCLSSIRQNLSRSFSSFVQKRNCGKAWMISAARRQVREPGPRHGGLGIWSALAIATDAETEAEILMACKFLSSLLTDCCFQQALRACTTGALSPGARVKFPAVTLDSWAIPSRARELVLRRRKIWSRMLQLFFPKELDRRAVDASTGAREKN